MKPSPAQITIRTKEGQVINFHTSQFNMEVINDLSWEGEDDLRTSSWKPKGNGKFSITGVMTNKGISMTAKRRLKYKKGRRK